MTTSAVPASSESQPDLDAASQAGASPSLLAATKRILEMIAAGASLTDILTNLCDAIDRQNPDMMSMVSLMDPDGQRLWPAATAAALANAVFAATGRRIRQLPLQKALTRQ